MMRLRFLALFQGLLCLLATSTAAHDPSVEDEDYKLVMGVARKLFGQRGDAVAQKVQEEDVPLREPTVQGSEVPKFSAGEGDDQSGGSLPVGEGIWSPHTDSDNNEVGDYSDVAEHINNLGEDLLAISILAQRISELFFKDIPEGRRNNSLPGEDQTKYTEVLAKEEELQVANKEGVANEIASSEKKVGPSSAAQFQHFKKFPSDYDASLPNNLFIPMPKENIYENNEDISGGVIHPVNQEAYGDTFDHQMDRMVAGHEDTFDHQKNEVSSKHENAFDHQIKEVSSKHDDAFDHQMDKMDDGHEDTFDHQMNKMFSRLKDTVDNLKNNVSSRHEDTFGHQMDEMGARHENTFDHQLVKMLAEIKGTLDHLINEVSSKHEDTFDQQMDKMSTGHKDTFDHQMDKKLAGLKDGREDLGEESDSEVDMEESRESMRLPDFLMDLGNLLVGENGESMPDFGESKSVNDFPSLKSKAEDVGMADSEEEELDEAKERIIDLRQI